MSEPNLFARAVAWLRAGYPNGLPINDYVPLFALLSRRLTAAEVVDVAKRLDREGLIHVTDDQISQMVRQVVDSPPREEDVARISAHLALDWPVSDADVLGDET